MNPMVRLLGKCAIIPLPVAEGNLMPTTRILRIEAIDDDLVYALRDRSVADRIQMIGAANRTARVLAAAGIRYQHPDWTEEQINAEVKKRVCGGPARTA
jgi:hypothetical protein